ncbi:VOC family protein [Streptomyces sp. JJ36]|uniref:VOC family protein n=1 Tax=Streptomyces sp. JJ36 TaxID=2736645 RepID=UPI001F2DEE74|nr:VOC family protein [Streptomyces sp. JJ36]
MSLATNSLDMAEGFYGAVLGWTFRPGRLGEEFRVAMAEGVPVAGIAEVTRTLGVPVAWTPFFAVDDADTVAARVRERVATVAVGPLALGDGRGALAADPDGATFGFWEGPVHASWDVAQGAPPARLELRTRDAFAAALFYGEVFEWAADAPGRCEVEYREGGVQIECAGHTVATLRGGAVEAAPDPHVRPRWHVSFSVDDVDDTVKAAVEAGGSVTDGPRDVPGGRTAGLRDRQGGLFTVAAR